MSWHNSIFDYKLTTTENPQKVKNSQSQLRLTVSYKKLYSSSITTPPPKIKIQQLHF